MLPYFYRCCHFPPYVHVQDLVGTHLSLAGLELYHGAELLSKVGAVSRTWECGQTRSPELCDVVRRSQLMFANTRGYLSDWSVCRRTEVTQMGVHQETITEVRTVCEVSKYTCRTAFTVCNVLLDSFDLVCNQRRIV